MFDLQKAGGIAALFEALAYVVGIGVMATVFNPGDTGGWSAAERLAFVLERKALYQAWTLFIYVAFGIALVVLAVALHDRLKVASRGLMEIATPFGLIWAGLVIASGMVASTGLETVAVMHARDVAQATSTWVAIDAVRDGLGGGVEVVGGVWVLLIGAASLQSPAYPRGLGYLALVVGLAGVLTLVPALDALGMVFGTCQIPWFAWIGIVMLRRIRD